ncbi:MAG: cell division ATP-binding protein FtsE [Desulfobulbaceae bacterium]|nr:cell division ATP-binding protein FtsE [Desulfobulbaceae bacterium]
MQTFFLENRPAVEMVKVSKVYPPDVAALQDVSFAIAKGEIVFLTGMSGAGKTSLLKLICCLERPTQGLIEVAGQDLSRLNARAIQKLRQKIGVAYQDFKLLPQRTVFQNIAVPMEITYQPARIIRQRVDELIEMLNLTDKRNKCIDELSRGEQQRVALARAAANTPPLLLADEPTGNLDNSTSRLVMNLFNHLNQMGTTIMIATHDETIFRDTDHRVLDLSHGHLAPAVAREP